jgi:hypothetical protein
MRTTFLDFIKQNNNINEAFDFDEVGKAMDLILSVLKKHITKIYAMPHGELIKDGSKTLFAKWYLLGNSEKSFTINWDQDKNEVYSISFFDKEQTHNLLWDKKAKSNLTIYTLGSSIVYFLPIIWTVAESDNFNITKEEAIKLGRSIYNEGKTNESYDLFIGKLNYEVFENISKNVINDTFNLTFEAVSDEVKAFKKKKRSDAVIADTNKKSSPEAKEQSKLAWKDYEEIRAAINGGADTMDKLKLALKRNVRLTMELDKTYKEAEEKEKEERDDPQTVFKKMEKYVNMVIKGINPSVILCGAPGVGKTYRVKTQLKANGYKEDSKNTSKEDLETITMSNAFVLFYVDESGKILKPANLDDEKYNKMCEILANIAISMLIQKFDTQGLEKLTNENG